MKKMNKKGFTIVELVIVIAVIAILAAVLIPTFSGIVDKANDSAALQEARNDYTEYVADVDYTTTTAAKDIIFETTKGKFVAVVDGKMQTTVYTSTEQAKTAFDAAYSGKTITVGDAATDTTGVNDVYKYYVVTVTTPTT